LCLSEAATALSLLEFPLSLSPCSPPPPLLPPLLISTNVPLRRRRHRPLLRRHPARSLSRGSRSRAAQSGGSCAATVPSGGLVPSPRGAATTAPHQRCSSPSSQTLSSPPRAVGRPRVLLPATPPREIRLRTHRSDLVAGLWPPVLSPCFLLAPTLHKLNLSCNTLAGMDSLRRCRISLHEAPLRWGKAGIWTVDGAAMTST
ncbi:unnamed protein product, partial [Urochloa humidicola]